MGIVDTHWQTCPECVGAGVVPMWSWWVQCGRCRGRRYVAVARRREFR